MILEDFYIETRSQDTWAKNDKFTQLNWYEMCSYLFM